MEIEAEKHEFVKNNALSKCWSCSSTCQLSKAVLHLSDGTQAGKVVLRVFQGLVGWSPHGPARLRVGNPFHVLFLTIWPVRLASAVGDQAEVPDLFHAMPIHALLGNEILPVPAILLGNLAALPVQFTIVASFHILEEDHGSPMGHHLQAPKEAVIDLLAALNVDALPC